MPEKIDIEIREMQQRMQEFLKVHWKFFLAEGAFFIILGIAAIIVPQIFTIAIALFIGWLLLLGGIVQIARAIRFIAMPGFNLWIFIGILQVIIGYYLIAQPAKGALTLTMLMTLFFAMEGIAKISLAFMMRPLAHWVWVFFSGFTALMLSVVVWAGWPGTAAWVLGMLLGINMIFLGGSLVRISLHHGGNA
jgi:uncharacterized membrane protein HdeD (DUF308 family)